MELFDANGVVYDVPAPKKKRKYPKRMTGGGFMVEFRKLTELLMSDKMTLLEQRVFHWLRLRLDYRKYATVYAKDLAEELGAERARVSDALGKLVELGLIERRRRSERSPAEYRLDADWGWNDDIDAWAKHQQTRKKLTVPEQIELGLLPRPNHGNVVPIRSDQPPPAE